jgi:hypothetical protein
MLEIYKVICTYFDNDIEKQKKWWAASNVLLGNQAPEEFVTTGRVHKLHQFVTQQWSLNTRT